MSDKTPLYLSQSNMIYSGDTDLTERYQSASNAWVKNLGKVLDQGELARGTVELINNCVTYDGSRPIVYVRGRRANYNFMAAEAAYIVAGRNDIGYIQNVMPGFERYSDDGYYQSGAYGPPWVDQLPYVIKTLTDDPTSRQAVVTIWRPRPGPSKDIPCTVALQFLVRRGEIHAVVTMRSSDIFTGLLYDMFCFAVMTSVVAHHLPFDVKIGSISINAGSSHIYDKDIDKAVDVLTQDYQVKHLRIQPKPASWWIHNLQIVAADQLDSSPLDRFRKVLGDAE